MNPMKWMRKNKKKIMAIVVVLLMIVFVGGYGLQQLFQPGIKGSTPIAHYYNKKGAITNDDLRGAQAELEILKALGADIFLQSRSSIMQTADIPSLALLETLFNESRISPAIDREIKRIANQQQLRLTDSEIDDFFRQQSREKPEIFWLLLKAEAREAGFVTPTEQAGAALKIIIPQIQQARGASADQIPTAEQVIQSLMDRMSVDQDTILRTFADLMAVMEYSSVITKNENVTLAQLKYETLVENQAMKLEMVMFNASQLASKSQQPAPDTVQKQFDAYKDYAPFDVNEQNPFGFGYMQPPQVKLDWMLVELSDVAKQVPAPTPEQTEEYYQRNQSQFTQEVSSDPNDPNSTKVSKVKTYAEVADQISKQLLESRIAERAENIMFSAKDMADANMTITDLENVAPEKLRSLIGDYKSIAGQIGQKFNLPVYAGQTNLVGPEDLMRNEFLGRLFMTGQDMTPTPIGTIIFAIDELKAAHLGPFAPAKPRMFESIGPCKDYMQRTVAIVRIIETQKAGSPANLDLSYVKKLPVALGGKIVESNDVYSVKDAVVEDVKKLQAWPIAKEAAEKLLAEAPKQGWDKALEAVNKQYGVANKAEPNKPADTFKLEPMEGLKRHSLQEIKMRQVKTAHDPVQSKFAKKFAQQKQLIDEFYALVEPDKTEAAGLPKIIENKPEMALYVVKSATRNLVDPNTYEQTKGRLVVMHDYIHGQSLGFEHFKPDNIIARMNFAWDEKTRNQPVRQDLPPEEF